jgi:hypothetical protein
MERAHRVPLRVHTGGQLGLPRCSWTWARAGADWTAPNYADTPATWSQPRARVATACTCGKADAARPATWRPRPMACRGHGRSCYRALGVDASC